MSKYNIMMFGFNTDDLDYTKYKLLYNIEFPIYLAKKSHAIISDKDEIFLFASKSQIMILNKKRKNPNKEILRNIPFIKRIYNNYDYNIYIPLLDNKTNEELIAYFKCTNILNYNNLTEQELYDDNYIDHNYLNLFFNKISKKEFIKCQD